MYVCVSFALDRVCLGETHASPTHASPTISIPDMLTRFTSGFAFIWLYDCTARTPSRCSLLLNKEDLALSHPAVPKYLIPAVRVPHPDSTASLLFGCTSIPSGLYRITAP